MNQNTKRNIAILVALLSFAGTGYLYKTNNHTYVPKKPNQTQQLLDVSPDEEEQDLFQPFYKDINNICGIATDKDGNHFAIASNDTCPTNAVLKENFGYTYEYSTETFAPKANGDTCGFAHYVQKDNNLNASDLRKLNELVHGNLNEIPVNPDGHGLCPNTEELSELITNSLGVPIRFEYNALNVNPENYPVVNVSMSDYSQTVAVPEQKDWSITGETMHGTKALRDTSGKLIPKVLLNDESNKLCGNDYAGKCAFDDKEMTLTNKDTKDVYRVWTHNGFALPIYMMRVGAWNVCNGNFDQCDFIQDGEQSGSVTNIVTKQTYHTPPNEQKEVVSDSPQQVSVDENSSETLIEVQ